MKSRPSSLSFRRYRVCDTWVERRREEFLEDSWAVVDFISFAAGERTMDLRLFILN
jgi:hypothetical protein